jgi:hypothetical protein
MLMYRKAYEECSRFVTTTELVYSSFDDPINCSISEAGLCEMLLFVCLSTPTNPIV